MTKSTKTAANVLPNHETAARLHAAINNALGQLQAACAVMRPVLDSEDAFLDHNATAAVTTITERAMAMLEAAGPAIDQLMRDGEAGPVRAVA